MKPKHNVWEYILMFGREDYRRFTMIGPAIKEDEAQRFLELHFDAEKIADFYPKTKKSR